ncbi:hypothetical protein BH09BAC5_BH09BAC5_21770 [soil metagenome]
MLKTGISLFFLTLFIANSVGFGFATFLQIKIHQNSEQWEMLNENLVDLRISPDEINMPSSTFQWLGKNEFLWKGSRYDVISAHSENEILVLKCYADNKEEYLYSKLKENNPTNENNLPEKNENNILKKDFEYDHPAFIFCFLSISISTLSNTSVALFIPLVLRPVASPPPWFY